MAYIRIAQAAPLNLMCGSEAPMIKSRPEPRLGGQRRNLETDAKIDIQNRMALIHYRILKLVTLLAVPHTNLLFLQNKLGISPMVVHTTHFSELQPYPIRWHGTVQSFGLSCESNIIII